jgi:hypothetical protein
MPRGARAPVARAVLRKWRREWWRRCGLVFMVF